jgi:hypothetical protein
MSDPKSFIILNAIIVTLLVVYFLTLKKKENPSRLNFKKPDIPLEDISKNLSGTPLNVMFNFNGHSFDAYEVLGVPAGSNMEEVKEAFQRSLGSASNDSSQEIFKVAYTAIQNASKRA